MKLTAEDYNCIGIVAKHCDNSKLCVAEHEALNFDLSGLFCDLWIDILAWWNEVDAYDNNPELPIPIDYEQKKALIYGGSYIDCSGRNVGFAGVKTVLTYYSYSRYIVLNGFSDTPNGMVQKTNEFSIPKSLKELEMFADKYRTMGKVTFERLSGYLCIENTVFGYKDCKGCGCGKCNPTTIAKGYGLRGRNISL